MGVSLGLTERVSLCSRCWDGQCAEGESLSSALPWVDYVWPIPPLGLRDLHMGMGKGIVVSEGGR